MYLEIHSSTRKLEVHVTATYTCGQDAFCKEQSRSIIHILTPFVKMLGRADVQYSQFAATYVLEVISVT